MAHATVEVLAERVRNDLEGFYGNRRTALA